MAADSTGVAGRMHCAGKDISINQSMRLWLIAGINLIGLSALGASVSFQSFDPTYFSTNGNVLKVIFADAATTTQSSNVLFISSSNVLHVLLGGSNQFWVVGTLTNNTTGSSARSTSSVNSTNVWGGFGTNISLFWSGVDTFRFYQPDSTHLLITNDNNAGLEIGADTIKWGGDSIVSGDLSAGGALSAASVSATSVATGNGADIQNLRISNLAPNLDGITNGQMLAMNGGQIGGSNLNLSSAFVLSSQYAGIATNATTADTATTSLDIDLTGAASNKVVQVVEAHTISIENIVTGTFTSVPYGYIKFTNGGIVYSIVVSTNLP